MSEKKKAKLFKLRYWFFDLVKVTGAIPGLLVFRPKIIYETPKARKRIRGGAILIGNHAGFIDPLYMMLSVWYRRHHFICAKEFFDAKAGIILKGFQCIGVNRTNFDMKSFKEIVNCLNEGCIVSLFPEGHINEEEGLGAFKSGMVMMALKSNTPIIPMYYQKPKVPVINRLHVAIGEPIDIREMFGERPSMNQINSITDMLYEKTLVLKHMVEGTDDNEKVK